MRNCKFLLVLPLLLSSGIVLSSCNNDTTTGSDLIISEIVEGSGNNKAVELYNLSDNEIDLTQYTLKLSFSEEKVFEIPLEGTLSAKSTYVITNSSSSDEIKTKSNLSSDSLLFNGSQTIELVKGKSLQDIVGVKGFFDGGWYKDVTLARKAEYLVGRKVFDEYDWIRYNEGNLNYLGKIEVSITEQELLAGPQITDEIRQADFCYRVGNTNEFLGGGGLASVFVTSYVDGDTTFFTFNNEQAKEAGITTSKVRYQNIDTPESYTGNIQEFGIVAKEYTKSELQKAGIFYVQSLKDGPIFETFDRVLGWVWADGTLMNHKIVKRGYSEVAFSSVDNMLYKDVSYTNFLYDAMLYAQKHELGKFGEVDPYWDYDKNQVKPGVQGSEK